MDLSQKEKHDNDVSKLSKYSARLHKANDTIQEGSSTEADTDTDCDGEVEQSLDLIYNAARAKLDETQAEQLAKLNGNNANHMRKIEQYNDLTKVTLKQVQSIQKKGT